MKFCATLHSDKVDLGEEFVSGAGVATVARAAEDAGFDTVFVTEHPIPSDTYLANGGHHALDPFVTLAVAAAATTRLRVLTHLSVIPYHKQYFHSGKIPDLRLVSHLGSSLATRTAPPGHLYLVGGECAAGTTKIFVVAVLHA